MLAERARLTLTIAVLSTATLATTASVLRPRCEKGAAPVVSEIERPAAIVGEDFCPPHVRASIHLGTDATLSCVRGQYPEPGTFVVAQYRTTEAWERFAVVADDGHLIVPMLDRPLTPDRPRR
jgi:hypothetical protein